MGASVYAYWPGITAEERAAQPGFGNDCKAWGEWMAEREDHEDVLEAVALLAGDAILTYTSDGIDDEDVDWFSPQQMEESARKLREFVLRDDPRTQRIVATYALSANNVEPVRDELARDLEDIAAIARHCADAGVARMTLEVNW